MLQAFSYFQKAYVNTPPPKGGGFELRLEAGLVRHARRTILLRNYHLAPEASDS